MEKSKDDAYEREMKRINSQIVTFSNPTEEDFTHSYDGMPYTIKAGEQMLFPYPVGMKLARHLAMKMIRKDLVKPGADPKDERQTNLYSPERMQSYLDKIIVVKEPGKIEDTKSEREKTKAEIERLNQSASEADNAPKPPEQKVTKKEVFKLLDERGIKYDKRASLGDLLEQVKQSEANG